MAFVTTQLSSNKKKTNLNKHVRLKKKIVKWGENEKYTIRAVYNLTPYNTNSVIVMSNRSTYS